MKHPYLGFSWRALSGCPEFEVCHYGLSSERAMEDAGVEVFALFTCDNPALWLGDHGGDLVVVGDGDDGPMFITLKDGPVVAGLRAQVAAISDALAVAVEPHDAATHEAATKAEHALGFALDDIRSMRTVL